MIRKKIILAILLSSAINGIAPSGMRAADSIANSDQQAFGDQFIEWLKARDVTISPYGIYCWIKENPFYSAAALCGSIVMYRHWLAYRKQMLNNIHILMINTHNDIIKNSASKSTRRKIADNMNASDKGLDGEDSESVRDAALDLLADKLSFTNYIFGRNVSLWPFSWIKRAK